ncbi:MAG: glycosyl hydrolase [Cytophagales bacterium]|jgi:glucan 1,3-beta-glucosidase|nr:glycosyl hydrolase [Cytophagales bacterium]MCA6387617.1 glycosyl hydrolase [Cytophagales bacterium]MCA6390263.1 glycosyl hydrolase [Cytophagales bacterium]MCA6395226.1 glycosyl hydrolase [Cytophagales bacterium]MCA6399402.1 glycosyl hydrolase [Cytophagales bacterium]
MSSKAEKLLSLAGQSYERATAESLRELFRKVLNAGMHGLGFSAYEEGQKPGEIITEKQIRRRLEIIRPYTKWIRSFSCIEGNELIPKIAKELGMKTLVGAWLGNDDKINQQEVENLIKISKEGYVDIAAVGNEVMLRGDLTEDELIAFITRVKKAIPVGIPVGYVDAYFEFDVKPRITAACDVVLANCYPYWEGCHIDYSLLYMKEMYNKAVRAANGKPVIISETGWPSQGTNFGAAMPSDQNFMKYFINTQKWSMEEDIEVFYFSSFDESWKVGAEGDVGASWGLWDKDEKLKY